MIAFRRLVMVLLSIVISACAAFRAESSKSEVTEDADPMIEPAPPQPPAPQLSAAEQLLVEAAQQVASGECNTAAATYRRLVEQHASSPHAAQALFQLAALQWNPASPVYDAGAAIGTLRQLATDHPESPWTPAATAILALARDKASLERAVATLQQQLDELKRLDLAPDG